MVPRATVVPPSLQFNESAYCLARLQPAFSHLPELMCEGEEEVSEGNENCWNGRLVGRYVITDHFTASKYVLMAACAVCDVIWRTAQVGKSNFLRIRRLFLKTEGSTEGLVKAAACSMPLRVSKKLSSVFLPFQLA